MRLQSSTLILASFPGSHALEPSIEVVQAWRAWYLWSYAFNLQSVWYSVPDSQTCVVSCLLPFVFRVFGHAHAQLRSFYLLSTFDGAHVTKKRYQVLPTCTMFTLRIVGTWEWGYPCCMFYKACCLCVDCRWMNVTIITIREASWLTDHTYTYDEVVKMMGELMAVFRGDLRVSVREGGWVGEVMSVKCAEW